MTNPISNQAAGRRHFLKKGCLITAGIGLAACGGLGAAAVYQPEIDLPSTMLGDKTMDNQRVLIAYASKAGSTAEIAAKMGESLSAQNLTVDVLPINKVTDLSGYQSVILGSAIRIGKPLPEALNFITKNQTVLQQKPFHFFVVCMTLQEDTEANRAAVSAYLDPVRALVKPTSEGLFAGVMDTNKLPLFERLMISMMKAPQGDFRKWDQIQAWAKSLPAS